MKRSFLMMALAAQLSAGAALAQTTPTPPTSPDPASPEALMSPNPFGWDWSTSLRTAMFGEDGTTVRPDKEIEAQWMTLSEEDRALIQRDCMVFVQSAPEDGVTEDSTGSAPPASPDSAEAPPSSDAEAVTAEGTPAVAPSTTEIFEISEENMQTICAATSSL